MNRPQVVIVGGGFGGLAAARKLDGKPVDVLLLDARNYHLFTPLLYQVATALLNPSDIAYPLRMRFRRSPNVRFRQALVDSIDLDGRSVVLAGGEHVPYDYLVLASGSANNYFRNEKLASATLGMKTLEGALALRNHVLSSLELAANEPDEQERRRLLTFVVVGGGPTGVEYAGALAELLKVVLGRDYPTLRPEDARIVVVEGRNRLLEALPARLSRYAEKALSRMGVEVRTKVLLEKATPDDALLSDGDFISTRTIVWAAGVRAQWPATEPEVAESRSRRVEVDEQLRVPGHPEVYAIGDAAAVHDGDVELPMMSPHAMQSARFAAQSILDDARGGDRSRRFRYRDKGTMATIGRHAAVGVIGRVRFVGGIGWIAWLLVHLYYLVGFRNRAAVFASWGWNYLRKDRPIRIIIRSERDRLSDRLPT